VRVSTLFLFLSQHTLILSADQIEFELRALDVYSAGLFLSTVAAVFGLRQHISSHKNTRKGEVLQFKLSNLD
jgi:hypothetical protein